MSRPFVLDASTTLSWAFNDEESSIEALEALETGIALVPSLWPYEVASGIVVALRRGRITSRQAEDFLSDLSALDIRVDDAPVDVEALVAACMGYGLTAYDASYVLLAESQGLALATGDREVRQAARQAHVPLVTSG